MTKPIEQASPSPYELTGYDRLMFDDELSAIDRMGRSTRREAIKNRGYPRARRVGLRSSWLYSEVIAWVRAQPFTEGLPNNARPSPTPHKALSEGIRKMRAKHGQLIGECGKTPSKVLGAMAKRAAEAGVVEAA